MQTNSIHTILPPNTRKLIELALEEDLGRGDLTSFAVPATTMATARIIARTPLTLSGTFLVETILQMAGIIPERLAVLLQDGEMAEAGQEILRLRAPARALLSVERSILNFLQRMCGIATQARAIQLKLTQENSMLTQENSANPKIRIVDTRKTLPGWRYLDKKAVRDGGLYNHRFGLDSGVLVKENHIRAAGGITKAIANLKAEIPHGIEIEVEVTNIQEAQEAIAAGIKILLLDNFTPEDLRSIVQELRSYSENLLLEASGNITPENILHYSASGVDIVSMGCLTHSVRAANLSMLFDFQE